MVHAESSSCKEEGDVENCLGGSVFVGDCLDSGRGHYDIIINQSDKVTCNLKYNNVKFKLCNNVTCLLYSLC